VDEEASQLIFGISSNLRLFTAESFLPRGESDDKDANTFELNPSRRGIETCFFCLL
jgi:hypothetical protein